MPPPRARTHGSGSAVNGQHTGPAADSSKEPLPPPGCLCSFHFSGGNMVCALLLKQSPRPPPSQLDQALYPVDLFSKGTASVFSLCPWEPQVSRVNASHQGGGRPLTARQRGRREATPGRGRQPSGGPAQLQADRPPAFRVPLAPSQHGQPDGKSPAFLPHPCAHISTWSFVTSNPPCGATKTISREAP